MKKTDLNKISKSLKDTFYTAEEYIKNPKKIEMLFKDLKEKEKIVNQITDKMQDFTLLVDLAKDYFAKRYTKLPIKSIVAIVATIIYVVNPFDLIPDAIIGIGITDDIGAVTLCIKMINSDLKDYKAWRNSQEVVSEQVIDNK